MSSQPAAAALSHGDASAPVLELAEITKTYPGVRALVDVSLALAPGTVHALLGENGAGKSTLIKIISGVERPDSGSYKLFGHLADIRNPRQAMQKGISVVHQERNLIPTFTVGENVLLDRVIGDGRRLVDRLRIHADALPFMEMVGLNVAPSSSVATLSAAQQQLIEIARALSSQRQDPASRRADRVDLAEGGLVAPRHAPQASPPGDFDHLCVAQARGGLRDLRRGEGAPRRPERRTAPCRRRACRGAISSR